QPALNAVMSFAFQHGLPTASVSNNASAAGGLLEYGPDRAWLYRRAASYHVDHILRGAKPADLPVEGPTVFDLVGNRTPAGTLGLAIPPDFATQVTSWID